MIEDAASVTGFEAGGVLQALEGIASFVTPVLPFLLLFMFVSFMFRWIASFIYHHIPKIGGDDLASLSSMSGPSTGVTDAQIATAYLNQGGDIRNATNQEFIRKWGRDHGWGM